MGGRAPRVTALGGGDSISYGKAAQLTLETADEALKVQEDLLAQIRTNNYLLVLLCRLEAGIPLTEKQLQRLKEVDD